MRGFPALESGGRSERGPRLTCSVALAVCADFAERTVTQNWDAAARSLCQELVTRWKEAVLTGSQEVLCREIADIREEEAQLNSELSEQEIRLNILAIGIQGIAIGASFYFSC